MGDVNKQRETVVPAWPERPRAESTFRADAEASKHSPPIRSEKEQMRRVASLGKKGK